MELSPKLLCHGFKRIITDKAISFLAEDQPMRSTMSITDARRNFSKLLDRVERGERIVITRYGKSFVAVIPIADLKLLVRSKAK
jgi:prevent-host-death family protein